MSDEQFKNEVISRLGVLEAFKDDSIAKLATLEALLGSQGRDIQGIKKDMDKIEKRIESLSIRVWIFVGGIIVTGFLIGVILTIFSMVK